MGNKKAVLSHDVPPCLTGDELVSGVKTTFSKGINESRHMRVDYASLSDDQLLITIGSHRDRAALAELYNRYKSTLGRFLQRQMCEAKLVDEIYNDVMLIVWNKASSFRGDSKVSTWLFGIAYRTRLTHSRKENRHRHSGTDELMANIESVDAGELETQVSLSESIHAALTELSEAHRTVIELAYFHGYSTAEIAGIVDCPQNTVKTRLFHARKKLKETLEAGQVVAVEEPINGNYESSEQQLNGFFVRRELLQAI